jgi:hypothetical protein
MHHYMKALRPAQMSPECRVFQDTSGRPYSYKSARNDIKRVLKEVGINPKRFGTHSFRIGSATFAALNNMPSEMIRFYGRWKSDCYKRYIRPSDGDLLKAAKAAFGKYSSKEKWNYDSQN